MNDKNKDEPVDGVDYFDTFYSISDTEDPQFGLNKLKKALKEFLQDHTSLLFHLLSCGYYFLQGDLIRLHYSIEIVSMQLYLKN